MRNRRISREIALQVLFQWEAQGFLASKQESLPSEINFSGLQSFLSQFVRDFYNKGSSHLDMTFIGLLLANTLNNIATIDQTIDNISTKWRLSRMNAIDRAILRLACCELNDKKLAPAIIINEAVELAKRYGGEASPLFINGLLDAIHRR